MSPIATSTYPPKPAIMTVMSFSLWRHWLHAQHYGRTYVRTETLSRLTYNDYCTHLLQQTVSCCEEPVGYGTFKIITFCFCMHLASWLYSSTYQWVRWCSARCVPQHHWDAASSRWCHEWVYCTQRSCNRPQIRFRSGLFGARDEFWCFLLQQLIISQTMLRCIMI